ncbi:Thiol-disulfide isomerase or thioredoxin [Arachidicoccus rhizosphaerae]|uniref:Thiol-disulfide isomerase or thioredoxin n=1 Tax=Arachidicoccus rhizosphaerae TaxID=551991 RepID=A0A1H4AZR7_9BACT|nr:TlpA disulfide reductase family protein [Arachidicoccus rhizosphaerae]SEA41350.1 Thiol-disulfide isomerase or thioredoxin [Arachidicoccus rhizosphaerae]
MKKISILAVLTLLFASAHAQVDAFNWRAVIHRPDGNGIVFNLRTAIEHDSLIFYVVNGKEQMRVPAVAQKGDSLLIDMPVFESGFKFKVINKDSLSGIWHRASVSKEIVLPLTASARNPERFLPVHGAPLTNLEGKWQVNYKDAAGEVSPAIFTFHQNDNLITGSVLTPFGDDRYLEGILTGDSLYFSGFDGIHSLLLKAKINGDSLTGLQFSGATSKEEFTAYKTDNPTLPNEAAMFLKPGESGHLNFTFKDLNGKDVSINDPRFKNKVVIIDLMGSWCPNCMDETAFLSQYYNANKDKGVEVISLAYELTTDFERSKKSLMKFQKAYDIQYPVLITGVTVTDKDRTSKTLPQFTDIKMFPTTIILDKTGKVVKIDTGFQGPGTGSYYTNYVKEFNELMNKLLAE